MQRTSFRAYLALLTLAVSSSVAAQSQYDHVEFRKIDSGTQYVVRPRAFELWESDIGVLDDEGFSVESKRFLLPGCYVTTPWLPVPLASRVRIYPGVDLEWSGILPRSAPADKVITTVYVEQRDLDRRVSGKTFNVNASRLGLNVLLDVDEDRRVWWGKIESSLDTVPSLVYPLDTQAPSELRVQLCHLVEGTVIDVHDVAVEVKPRI